MHLEAHLLLAFSLLVVVYGDVLFLQTFDTLPSLPYQPPPFPFQSSDLTYSNVSNQTSYNAPNSAKVVGSGSILFPLSTLNYNSITLSFQSQCTPLATSSSSCIEYTADGFIWISVQTFSQGVMDTHTWYTTTVTLPSTADNNPLFALRLRAATGPTEISYWDNIQVTATAGVGPGVIQNGVVSRSVLTKTYLTTGTAATTTPCSTGEFFLPPTGAPPSSSPGNNFLQGTLTLNGGSNIQLGSGIQTILDTYAYNQNPYKNANGMTYLPPFSFSFYTTIISGVTHVIPVSRGSNPSTHPHYEWIIGPGRMWYEVADGTYTRVSLPVSLTQRNANCIQNGMLTFLFNSGTITSPPTSPTSATISKVFFQITAETCSYFQANYWGLTSATLTLSSITNVATLQVAYVNEINARLPVRPFFLLPQDNPSANLSMYNFGNGITQTAISFYALTGWQYNNLDVVYSTGVMTRYGSYPFNSDFVVPSFSLTKSYVVSVTAQALSQLSGSSFYSTLLSTQCPSMSTGSPTLRNALNMATGYYTTTSYMVDENSDATTNNFFLEFSNLQKMSQGVGGHAPVLGTVCGYSHHTPGTTWVYHTSDFYLAARTLEAQPLLNNSYSSSITNFWNSVVAGPLKLSPLIQIPRTTTSDSPNPSKTWGAWGYFLLLDDIAKLTNFINKGEGKNPSTPTTSILDPVYLNKALQRDTTDVGLTIPNLGSTASPYSSSNPFTYRYNLGFWATNAFDSTLSVPGFPDYIPAGGYPCTNSANTPVGNTTAVSGYYIPYSSGFGGISVALSPNRINFIVFSDADQYVWVPAVRESIKLKNFCQAGLY